jgi:hypothetical protein
MAATPEARNLGDGITVAELKERLDVFDPDLRVQIGEVGKPLLWEDIHVGIKRTLVLEQHSTR